MALLMQNFLLSSGTSEVKKEAEKEKSTNYQYALNKDNQEKLKQFSTKGKKPTIIALYDEKDGATNADRAILDFKEKGLEVVSVTPARGIEHPVFKEKNFDGIYLPGGSDVPIHDKHDPRKNFEEQLIDKACQEDIPLLGICRGQQIIGFHNGLNLGDLPEKEFGEHYSHAGDISHDAHNVFLNSTVQVEKDSNLHDALADKVFGHSSEENNFVYDVACLHHQRLTSSFFKNPAVKTTSYDTFDDTIESIEAPTNKNGKYHILGFQHHPEVITSAARNQRTKELAKISDEKNNVEMFHYRDPEMGQYLELKARQKRSSVYKQPTEERIANAELELFTDQVKHKFLDQHSPVKPAPSENPTTKNASFGDLSDRLFNLFSIKRDSHSHSHQENPLKKACLQR